MAGANAPTLHEDAVMRNRGGADPNAPYAMPGRGVRLAKRPVLLDVNAAEPCTTQQLSLFESGAHVDGDRRSVRLNLVNRGSAACRLSGYPAISLLRRDGSLIGSISIARIGATTLEAAFNTGPLAEHTGPGREDAGLSSAAVASDTPSAVVLLVPAGEATFEVGWTSGTACDQVGAIAVAPPGSTQSFTVRHELTVCAGRILVTAISDGSQM